MPGKQGYSEKGKLISGFTGSFYFLKGKVFVFPFQVVLGPCLSSPIYWYSMYHQLNSLFHVLIKHRKYMVLLQIWFCFSSCIPSLSEEILGIVIFFRSFESEMFLQLKSTSGLRGWRKSDCCWGQKCVMCVKLI